MNQDILNNMQIGEKTVDIQEYYHGENGKNLVYKVTIYECIRTFIFFKKIKTFSYPFYFASKEFAESFIKVFDKFEIKKYSYSSYDCYYDTINRKIYYALFPKEFNSPKYMYYMVDVRHPISLSEANSMSLDSDGIWGGTVNFGRISLDQRLYTEIIEKEKLASKEGTVGQTFSYKLSEA